jgi:CBS domain containing-hemolysin-like protein
MSDELLGPIALIAALLCCSAFFSGSEVALFSLRRVDRAQLGKGARPADARILALLARPRRTIATLLIGNESVNISISAVMAGLVGRIWPDRGEIALSLLAVAFALPALLLFGEITPKTIAIKNALGFARRIALPLRLFGLVVTPVRVVVRAIADLIAWPFGGRAPADRAELSEAEFKALVDAGAGEGQVAAAERRLIHRVFEFGDKTVAEAMRPRGEVFALSYSRSLAQLGQEVAARGLSRVPIYRQSLDEIVGVLHAKDLVVHGSGVEGPRRLTDLLHEPLFVPQTTRLERLFRVFKQKKTHLAIVVNEYGKVAGLVTMEDVLEQLFGELAAEAAANRAHTPVPEAAP